MLRTPVPGGIRMAAQRRDDAAAGGLREIEARGLRREEVGDVAGDQRAGRGHADEDRAGPGADRGARLLAERGVRLVADDDRVGVGDPPGVAHEPLVGLDGHRAVGAVGALAVEQRGRAPFGVAAVLQLVDELIDEVAAVGEDQDAAGAGRLDEAHRGDGLAGARRVLEPEALVGVGVVERLLVDVLVGLGARRLEVLERLFLGLRFELLLDSSASGSSSDDVLVGSSSSSSSSVALRCPSPRPRRRRRLPLRRVGLVLTSGLVDGIAPSTASTGRRARSGSVSPSAGWAWRAARRACPRARRPGAG